MNLSKFQVRFGLSSFSLAKWSTAIKQLQTTKVGVVVWLLLLMMMVCNENVLLGCSYSSGVVGGPGGSLAVVPPNRTKHVEINFNFISSLFSQFNYVQRAGLLCMSWLAVDRMRLVMLLLPEPPPTLSFPPSRLECPFVVFMLVLVGRCLSSCSLGRVITNVGGIRN